MESKLKRGGGKSRLDMEWVQAHQVDNLVEEQVWLRQASGWAWLGRLVAVTSDHYVLDRCSWSKMTGHDYGAFVRGELQEGGELYTYHPAEPVYVPFDGAEITPWRGVLPELTPEQLKAADKKRADYKKRMEAES